MMSFDVWYVQLFISTSACLSHGELMTWLQIISAWSIFSFLRYFILVILRDVNTTSCPLLSSFEFVLYCGLFRFKLFSRHWINWSTVWTFL